ncbi:MAG: hypothetical protein LUC99_12565 [Clostridiales bacterium]|nr:hypothetical protein [Clostridiales bacterium]
MKKIALLIACALLGLTACSSSSNHSSTKETTVSNKETTAIADHKEDEAEADKAEPEIEETEPATEPETEADQKKGLDITSLTIGDETISEGRKLCCLLPPFRCAKENRS